MTKMCRGVRGATTADENTRESILTASIQLLALMIRMNDIDPDDVSSAIFTVTRDLDAEFPALAARQLGWNDVPLLCSYEIDVPGSLDRCIRVLVNWNTEKSQQEIVHAYIKQAKNLRPDLRKLPPIDFAELEAWIAAYMASHEVEVKSGARTVENPPSP
jgi:chorismate mutase